MSIMRCQKHDIQFDSDFNVECPLCEGETQECAENPSSSKASKLLKLTNIRRRGVTGYPNSFDKQEI